MENATLTLKLLKESFGVCRLKSDDALPDWALKGTFHSITYTEDELSIVCETAWIPNTIQCEKTWRIFKIQGPLDFALIGILAKIGQLMADHQISIFALSTFDTDYILVKEDKVTKATHALKQAGYEVIEASE